jgi:hypothetical protein
MKRQFTRAEKDLIRAYALDREPATSERVLKVRLLHSGDARAYCKDGHIYLIAPTAALFAEARRTFHKGLLCNGHAPRAVIPESGVKIADLRFGVVLVGSLF